jgi:putative membrane protein
VTNRVQLFLFFAVFVWSLIHPHDYFTWILEVFPAIIGILLIFALRRRFPFTPLVLTLLTLHAIILMVGGHYTYAEVPVGFWMKSAFHFTRNHYDRIGHFAQGFVPAMVAREVLIRRDVVRTRGWRYFIIVSICLAISAAYELIEWRQRRDRQRRRRLPRHARRCLGYAGGYGHGAGGCAHGAADFGPLAGSPDRAAATRSRTPRKSVRNQSTSIMIPIVR